MNAIGNRKTVGSLLHMHALTSVHWGTGASLGTVDLPIQRERHTEWPNGAGSALKGVLRDACRESLALSGVSRDEVDQHDRIRRLFGSAKTGSEDTNAGALCVTDARILAFPVRSLKGVFAWISCPAILDRLGRDMGLAGVEFTAPSFTPSDVKALVADGCSLIVADKYIQLDDETLEVEQQRVTELAQWLAENCISSGSAYTATKQRFAKQFVIVSDNVFTHFSKYATEIVARIGLDYNTKTVKPGALFYQELLPAESLMYAVVLVNDSRSRDLKSGSQLLSDFKSMLEKTSVLQVGGDETTGKGYCSIHFSEPKA